MARIRRNLSTPEGKQIWEAIDKAASEAPQWLKERLKARLNEERRIEARQMEAER